MPVRREWCSDHLRPPGQLHRAAAVMREVTLRIDDLAVHRDVLTAGRCLARGRGGMRHHVGREHQARANGQVPK